MHETLYIASAYKPLIEFNAQFFLQILNTLILFSFLSWKLFKPISAVLEKRKQNIAKSYDDADMAVYEANELKKSYENKLNEIRGEREEILAKARNTANKQAQDIVNKAEEEAKLIKENNQKQIEAERQKAMAELKEEVSTLAVLAAAKILKKEVDSKTNRDMISEFIEGVGDISWNK